MNHLTAWSDLPDAVWRACLGRALGLRQLARESGRPPWTQAAAGRSVGLVFFNPSLRTRASMELAAAQLGAHAVTLTPGAGMWGIETRDGVTMNGEAAEHAREAFGVLGRYVDALGVRTFATLADHDADRDDRAFRAAVAASSVPVVNLESARWHPCQALADAATVAEVWGDGDPDGARGRKLVLHWAPHPKPLPRAVPNSALLMAARLGLETVVVRPDGFGLDDDVLDLARQTAARTGGSVTESTDRAAALAGAHVVYAKAWAGSAVYDAPEAEARQRRAHADWTVTADSMSRTDRAVFMHCLPVRRGVVVDAEVLDGDRAAHLLQAEYRLHAQKAILEWVWGLDGSEVQGPLPRRA